MQDRRTGHNLQADKSICQSKAEPVLSHLSLRGRTTAFGMIVDAFLAIRALSTYGAFDVLEPNRDRVVLFEHIRTAR